MRIVDRRPAGERLLSRLDHEPDGLFARVLAPLGWVWERSAAARRHLVRDLPLDAPVPTLGVGNLRVGGSGKTPVVEDLGRRLLAEDHRVAVLTRGYRSGAGGDEPAWLDRAGLQVCAGADRRRSLHMALQRGADRILLDDALQTRHRPAATIALVLDRDLSRPPRCLPAGPAREGSQALARAAALLVRREAPDDVPVPDGALGFRLVPVGFLGRDGTAAAAPEGRGILASGLARPESFEADASALDLDIAASWRQTDHWDPDASAVRDLGALVRETGAAWILVPEKNLERLASRAPALPVVGLRSRIRFDDDVDPLEWLRGRGIGI